MVLSFNLMLGENYCINWILSLQLALMGRMTSPALFKHYTLNYPHQQSLGLRMMMMSWNGQNTRSKKLICLLWININSLQIGYFPNEKAFSLRYQTAGMLETVLRQGVLGEDDIGEESPRNLKLPSRRPSIVCESCLYSLEKDMRARAFHIMDPKGVVEMLLIFLEERGEGLLDHPSISHTTADNTDRVSPFLGRWKGHSLTKRSGVYGATIAEADTVASLEMDDKGKLIQNMASTSAGGDVTTSVPWTGVMLNNMVIFEGGYQITLLPGGMYMGSPCDVSRSVAESKSFHLEFCWLESPGKRQRLVRTYDVEGLAVSSTYFYETKI
ncbi:uncharacterized protein LOC115701459 isoform X2 [Cannabis sativa]|uniref:uncharacterized protein LOC115701459 isoform X2 n=1 Tax=Cannabis sativa TaxID=3483 RepID=UPI0029C9DC91|nr:uncharacterized protein LOC115701459 isoform X2 [Cannabis sativa]